MFGTLSDPSWGKLKLPGIRLLGVKLVGGKLVGGRQPGGGNLVPWLRPNVTFPSGGTEAAAAVAAMEMEGSGSAKCATGWRTQ